MRARDPTHTHSKWENRREIKPKECFAFLILILFSLIPIHSNGFSRKRGVCAYSVAQFLVSNCMETWETRTNPKSGISK